MILNSQKLNVPAQTPSLDEEMQSLHTYIIFALLSISSILSAGFKVLINIFSEFILKESKQSHFADTTSCVVNDDWSQVLTVAPKGNMNVWKHGCILNNNNIAIVVCPSYDPSNNYIETAQCAIGDSDNSDDSAWKSSLLLSTSNQSYSVDSFLDDNGNYIVARSTRDCQDIRNIDYTSGLIN